MVDFYGKFIAQYTMDLHGSTIGRLTSRRAQELISRMLLRRRFDEGEVVTQKKKTAVFCWSHFVVFFVLQSNDEPYFFFL